jgi:prepilin signal peptidase PulO-like enzyme (type II secretory pathway)
MLYHIIYALLLLLGGWCAFKMSQADLRRRIIPDVYLFPFLLIGLVIVCYFPWISTVDESVIAASMGYLMGVIIGFIFEKTKLGKKNPNYAPIGFGDVKLLAAGGIWLGTTGLALAIIISCVIGGIWGLLKKQKYIPFAPFFIAGAIIALISLWFLL